MTLKEKIALFPHSPGVYRYYDSEGNVIYVGKAKDLHKRVAQYFVPPERLTRKTAIMVSKIADAQYSVVDTEADALLLENNLIKQYKPKYNILLKDSKTYPWICISADEYPRVFLTRRIVKDGSMYFGPYSSVMHARNLLELFSSLYPLRTCNLKITSEAILRGKFRPEFLNRLDEIVYYKSLTKEEARQIVSLQLEDLRRRMEEGKRLHLQVTDRAKDAIIDAAYDSIYGARPIKRFIQSRIETLIAKAIIGGSYAEGDTLTVDWDGSAFTLG